MNINTNKHLKKARREIRKRARKIRRRFMKFEPDSPQVRRFLLCFMIAFFLVADVAVWSSGTIAPEKYPAVVERTPSQLELKARELTSGHPMSNMVRYIVRKDPRVASYMLAIAKKESNLGRYSPKKDGRDCYNYWGYRGEYNQTASGYSCFDSPRHAVEVVGVRVNDLLAQNIDTPEEMLVWKCGSSCEGHNPDDVAKWVRDVDFYYRRMYN